MKNKQILKKKNVKKELMMRFANVYCNEEAFFREVYPKFSLKIAKAIVYFLTNKEIVWSDGRVSYYSQRLLPAVLTGMVYEKRVRKIPYWVFRGGTADDLGGEEFIEKVKQQMLRHQAVKEIRCWTENPKNKWLLKDQWKE